MPNRHKKHKTNHTTQYDLSHEEIWDDSALIRSWEEAVKEYEYYHSIAARGEDIEEVLRAAEEAEGNDQDITLALEQLDGNGDGTHQGDGIDVEDGEVEEGEVEDGEVEGSAQPPTVNGFLEHSSSPRKITKHPIHGPFQPEQNRGSTQSFAYAPQHPIEPVASPKPQKEQSTEQSQAQTLENIKMAYYWAGYYSGLYEGQRQASNAPR